MWFYRRQWHRFEEKGNVEFFFKERLQSDQSTRAKSAGNDYSRNILKIFILATSVVSNYPKECPLTKIFDEDPILGDKKFFWPELRRLPATTEKYRKGSRYLYPWSSVIQFSINIFIDFLTNNTKQYFTRVAKQSLLRIEHEEEGEICWFCSGNICHSWGFIDFSFNNTQCCLYWEKANVLAKFCVLFLKYILY